MEETHGSARMAESARHAERKRPRKQTARRRSGLLASLVLGVSLLSGCSATIGGTLCDMNLQNPHQSHGSPRYMDSKISFSCNGAVSKASVTIKMQKRTANGGWVDVPNSQNTVGPFDLPARTNKKVMTRGNLICAVGTYRTAGKGKATNAQGVSNSIDWAYGDPISVTCPR